MAYNTKAIKKDVDGKPIPQVFNPILDEYEALKGDAGAARHVIYGPDGNPITTTGDKLAVRATEIETLLTGIQGYIDTLEAVLGEAQANPAEYTIQARVKNLEDKLAAITTDGIKLSGSSMELYGASVGDRPEATGVAAGTTFTIVDDTQEFKTWMANGVDWVEV